MNEIVVILTKVLLFVVAGLCIAALSYYAVGWMWKNRGKAILLALFLITIPFLIKFLP